MASIIKSENKDIVQTYIFTMARFNWTIAEKRIILRIIEFNQDMTAGIKELRDYSCRASLFQDRVYTMPMRCFLRDDTDQNYAQVRAGFKGLMTKILEFESSDGSWLMTAIVNSPSYDAKNGIVKFTLHSTVYEAFLNFSKGYRDFELLTAMSFECVHSMRFYEIFSRETEPMLYSLELLKKMFGVAKKYKQVNDFVKKVIEPAKRELDAKSPYTFTYKARKEGRKIIGWMC
jgi:plasmid replication initiation protein